MIRELEVNERRQHEKVYIHSISENVDVHKLSQASNLINFLSSQRGSLVFGTVMSIWKFRGAYKSSLPLAFYPERGKEKCGQVSLHFLFSCVLLQNKILLTLYHKLFTRLSKMMKLNVLKQEHKEVIWEKNRPYTTALGHNDYKEKVIIQRK